MEWSIKRALTFTVTFLLFISAVASGHEMCVNGNGEIKAEMRSVKAFNTIDVSGIFEVNIKIGKKERLIVKADSNLLPYIVTKTNRNTLHIDSSKSICTANDLSVEIWTNSIVGLAAAGSNNISISAISSPIFKIVSDGTNEIFLTGTAGHFTAELNGTSDLDGKALKSSRTDVIINGAANAEVYASKHLNAIINGAGDLTCYGHPVSVTKQINGVGEIFIE